MKNLGIPGSIAPYLLEMNRNQHEKILHETKDARYIYLVIIIGNLPMNGYYIEGLIFTLR